MGGQLDQFCEMEIDETLGGIRYYKQFHDKSFMIDCQKSSFFIGNPDENFAKGEYYLQIPTYFVQCEDTCDQQEILFLK